AHGRRDRASGRSQFRRISAHGAVSTLASDRFVGVRRAPERGRVLLSRDGRPFVTGVLTITMVKRRLMRTTYSVFATMLLLSAVPSMSVAQIVVPYGRDDA